MQLFFAEDEVAALIVSNGCQIRLPIESEVEGDVLEIGNILTMIVLSIQKSLMLVCPTMRRL